MYWAQTRYQQLRKEEALQQVTVGGGGVAHEGMHGIVDNLAGCKWEGEGVLFRQMHKQSIITFCFTIVNVS